MKEEKSRILIIEDDNHIAEGLRLNLDLQGFEVRLATDGMSGLQLWRQWQPHLIVLDIMLPGMDGLSILQNIRLDDQWLPILIISAKADADDRVKGLSFGVDDYLTKPFNLEEFLLRVKRLLTRAVRQKEAEGGQENDPVTEMAAYVFGPNRIDLARATAETASGSIQLTDQEMRLLKVFIANKGRVLSRRQLLEIGWGYPRGTTTRTLDNFIVRFRRYFEDNPKKPVYFKSHRSVGYIFDHN